MTEPQPTDSFSWPPASTADAYEDQAMQGDPNGGLFLSSTPSAETSYPQSPGAQTPGADTELIGDNFVEPQIVPHIAPEQHVSAEQHLAPTWQPAPTIGVAADSLRGQAEAQTHLLQTGFSQRADVVHEQDAVHERSDLSSRGQLESQIVSANDAWAQASTLSRATDSAAARVDVPTFAANTEWDANGDVVAATNNATEPAGLQSDSVLSRVENVQVRAHLEEPEPDESPGVAMPPLRAPGLRLGSSGPLLQQTTSQPEPVEVAPTSSMPAALASTINAFTQSSVTNQPVTDETPSPSSLETASLQQHTAEAHNIGSTNSAWAATTAQSGFVGAAPVVPAVAIEDVPPVPSAWSPISSEFVSSEQVSPESIVAPTVVPLNDVSVSPAMTSSEQVSPYSSSAESMSSQSMPTQLSSDDDMPPRPPIITTPRVGTFQSTAPNAFQTVEPNPIAHVSGTQPEGQEQPLTPAIEPIKLDEFPVAMRLPPVIITPPALAPLPDAAKLTPVSVPVGVSTEVATPKVESEEAKKDRRFGRKKSAKTQPELVGVASGAQHSDVAPIAAQTASEMPVMHSVSVAADGMAASTIDATTDTVGLDAVSDGANKKSKKAKKSLFAKVDRSEEKELFPSSGTRANLIRGVSAALLLAGVALFAVSVFGKTDRPTPKVPATSVLTADSAPIGANPVDTVASGNSLGSVPPPDTVPNDDFFSQPGDFTAK